MSQENLDFLKSKALNEHRLAFAYRSKFRPISTQDLGIVNSEGAILKTLYLRVVFITLLQRIEKKKCKTISLTIVKT